MAHHDKIDPDTFFGEYIEQLRSNEQRLRDALTGHKVSEVARSVTSLTLRINDDFDVLVTNKDYSSVGELHQAVMSLDEVVARANHEPATHVAVIYDYSGVPNVAAVVSKDTPELAELATIPLFTLVPTLYASHARNTRLDGVWYIANDDEFPYPYKDKCYLSLADAGRAMSSEHNADVQGGDWSLHHLTIEHPAKS